MSGLPSIVVVGFCFIGRKCASAASPYSECPSIDTLLIGEWCVVSARLADLPVLPQTEMPVAEQFKTTLQGGKLVTVVNEST